MTGIPGAGAEAAAIHSAFAVSVTYTGGGLSGETVDAVPIDIAAEPFLGGGSSARTRTFEIREASFSSDPANNDIVVDAEGSWRVIDVTRHRGIEAWHLSAELT